MLQELRIGNFVGLNLEEFKDNFFTVLEVGETMKVYEGLITIKGANIKRVETSFMYVDDFEPIPLTEDWLIRLGFIKIDNKQEYLKSSNGRYHNVSLEGLEPRYGMGYSSDGIIQVPIYHVHTLQNLYFALTGTELTINNGGN